MVRSKHGLLMLMLASALWLVVGGPLASGLNRSSSSPYDDFPLAKDVQGKSYALLGEGKLPNRTRWGAYASRIGRGLKGRQQPCLSVARITLEGEYGNASQCGPLAPTEPGEPPVLVSITGSYINRPGGPTIGEGVYAISVAPVVMHLRLVASSGRVLSLRTKLFNNTQRRKTGLSKFRYVSLGMQSDLCISGIEGYDSAGTKVLDEETFMCAESSSARSGNS
jgi:hypothetical protein